MKVVSLVLLLAAFLAGCGTPAPVPDDHYYRLAASTLDQGLDEPALAGLLLVEVPSAAGVRRGRKMLYSDDRQHLRFQQYHYHHWEDALPHMLHRWLVERLKAANLADELAAKATARENFRLGSRIDRFERLVDGDRFSVLVSIEFNLTGEQGEPVFEQSFKASATANGSSMEATVVAFSSALDQIGGQLIEALADDKPQ
jgi:ABC-type uncharacterized transport system auxiliary subunit